MFDLRHLEHSTIIYEDPQHTPLLRLAWNKQDPNYLATVAMDACEVSSYGNCFVVSWWKKIICFCYQLHLNSGAFSSQCSRNHMVEYVDVNIRTVLPHYIHINCTFCKN